MADCIESKIDVRGCKIHMRRGGKGGPMLFLHGAGGIPGWIPAFQSLADRFDVMAPDHPSFGLSDQPDWLDDMNDLALFYLDLIDALQLDGVHVVGQSLGGWLALEMAVRNCTKIKSLTLVGSAGIRIKGKPIADIFMMDPADLTRELFFDKSYADRILGMNVSDEQLDIQIRNRVSTARLGWQPRLFNPALRKWLHRITVPVHVVWGDSDKIVDPAYAAEFGRVLAGAQVTMIGKAGHLPHIEQAGPFVDAVSGFIAKRAA